VSTLGRNLSSESSRTGEETNTPLLSEPIFHLTLFFELLFGWFWFTCDLGHISYWQQLIFLALQMEMVSLCLLDKIIVMTKLCEQVLQARNLPNSIQ
jgi:hypothetical protein